MLIFTLTDNGQPWILQEVRTTCNCAFSHLTKLPVLSSHGFYSNRETGANDVRGRSRRTTNVSAAIDGGKLTGESGAGRDPQGLGTTRADAQLLEPPPRLPIVDEDKSAMHWPSMGQLVSIFLWQKHARDFLSAMNMLMGKV